MSKWINAQGYTITTRGTVYTINRNGNTWSTDVSRWTDSAEQWIRNDIKAGHYEGFKEVTEEEGTNV